MSGVGALASFRQLERMAASRPLLKFKLGHYPPSVVSLIHSAAAHRSGRQARVQGHLLVTTSFAIAFFRRLAGFLTTF
jgi:hypothetical protein